MGEGRKPALWQSWETDDWEQKPSTGFEGWDQPSWQQPFAETDPGQSGQADGWNTVNPISSTPADDWEEGGGNQWGSWEQPTAPVQPRESQNRNTRRSAGGFGLWEQVKSWGEEKFSLPPISRPAPAQSVVPRPAPVRSALTPHLQAICRAVEGMESTVRLAGVEEGELRALMRQVLKRPEYFWLDGHYSYRIQGGQTEVFLQWRYTDVVQRRRQLEQVTSQILARMPRGEEYRRALYLHDWLCDNITYLDRGRGTGRDIYEALCLRSCVCAGYAKAYSYLMKKAGVRCAVVEGTARGERHAWNRVVIGGNLYYTDVTWDGKEGNWRCYEWFNLTSAQMLESHHPDNPADMPVSTATADNFYRRGGLLLSAWDEGQLVRILARQKGNTLLVGFDRRQVYNKARERCNQSDFCQLLQRAGHPCRSWLIKSTKNGWGIALVLEE